MSLHELEPDPEAPQADLRLVAEVDATRAVVDDLRGAMARLEGVTSYLQERLGEVSGERDELAATLRGSRDELAAARTELARLTERADQEQSRRVALESEVDDLRSDLAATEAELSELRGEVSRLEVANAELATQRTELASQRARKYRNLPLPGSAS